MQETTYEQRFINTVKQFQNRENYETSFHSNKDVFYFYFRKAKVCPDTVYKTISDFSVYRNDAFEDNLKQHWEHFCTIFHEVK